MAGEHRVQDMNQPTLDKAKQSVLKVWPSAGVVHDDAFAGGAWFITHDAQTVLGKGNSEEEAWENAAKNLCAPQP